VYRLATVDVKSFLLNNKIQLLSFMFIINFSYEIFASQSLLSLPYYLYLISSAGESPAAGDDAFTKCAGAGPKPSFW